MNAAKMMEQFVEDRSYFHLKRMENYRQHFRSLLKQEFKHYEQTRIENELYGYVAKWRKMPVYETDHEGLNHFLHDHGLFLPLASIPLKGLSPDVKRDLATFELRDYALKVTPNKQGRVIVDQIPDRDFSVEEMWSYYIRSDREFQNLSAAYEELKVNIIQCPELKKKKKIKHDFGSVSLYEKVVGYNLHSILEWYGEEFLMEYARVDRSQLDIYMAKGLIQPKDIEPFRKVKDIDLQFLIMTSEAEKSMLSHFDQRIHMLARISSKDSA